MFKFTKENVNSFNPDQWPLYEKKRLTKALLVEGPFEVETREGKLSCPDGFVALDSEGWPYPIHKTEFEKIYRKKDENRT